MLALIPQSGDSSLCLGRLGLPDRLPFSQPQGHDYFEAKSQLASPHSECVPSQSFRSPNKPCYSSYSKGILRVYKNKYSALYSAPINFFQKTHLLEISVNTGLLACYNYLLTAKFSKCMHKITKTLSIQHYYIIQRLV